MKLLAGAALVLALGSAAVARAEEDVVYNAVDSELAITGAAEAYGVSEAWLLAVARCEATMDPYAVGDHGHSFGLAQLNDRRTGLLSHFHSLGYVDAFNPYEAADYLGRAFSGEFRREGIGSWRWSCA